MPQPPLELATLYTRDHSSKVLIEVLPLCRLTAVLRLKPDRLRTHNRCNPNAWYLPRIANSAINTALDAVGAVVIEGPRACGKTWTATQFARSEVLFDGSDEEQMALAVDPARILDSEAPRLLDEWHLGPKVWNAMRRACDDRREKGIFLLKGVAVPPDGITWHSGAGRVLRVRMRTMTLAEFRRDCLCVVRVCR